MSQIDTRSYRIPPSASPQHRAPRRWPRSGVIVIHTAESTPDLVLPDDGAEGVAKFIQRRSDHGSYHSIFDSDSTVALIHPGHEAFHDGTGTNRHSLGFSFACHAHQWPTLPAPWVAGAMEQAGREIALQIDHIRRSSGIVVPLARIPADAARARQPGFLGHGELDPGRRSDPGAAFPWPLLFAAIARHLQSPTAALLREEPDMTPELEKIVRDMAADVAEIKAAAMLASTPENTVRAAYRRLLGRKPDAAGFEVWVKYLRNGGSLSAMIEMFLLSPEGLSRQSST